MLENELELDSTAFQLISPQGQILNCDLACLAFRVEFSKFRFRSETTTAAAILSAKNSIKISLVYFAAPHLKKCVCLNGIQ